MRVTDHRMALMLRGVQPVNRVERRALRKKLNDMGAYERAKLRAAADRVGKGNTNVS